VTSALAGSWFVYAGWVQWRLAPYRLTLPLVVLGEVTVVVLLLLSHVPDKRDWRPFSLCCTLVATYYFVAVRLAPGVHLISEPTACVFQAIGLGWALFAKLSLRRSFGLLPANRGIVTTGAYRFVRHPIYTGYFVGHMAFLLANFCWQNVLVYVLLYAMQIVRVLREEALLSSDHTYRAYMQRVRFRAVPGVF